jgi:hypothetical protein
MRPSYEDTAITSLLEKMAQLNSRKPGYDGVTIISGVENMTLFIPDPQFNDPWTRLLVT